MRCARCTSAQAHPLTDSRPSPAAQRPRHSDRRWQPRRRCPQRGAGGAGAPARTALGAGSGLPRARGESSARPAARPSASAGSCLLPAGSQASRKASADCARATRLCAGLFAISGRPLRSMATAGGQLRRAGSIPASVDASGAPFSSLRTRPAGSSKRYQSPKPRAPAPKGSHRRRKVGSRPLPHRHQRWSLDLSGCCSMRGQNVVVRVVHEHFEMRAMRALGPAPAQQPRMVSRGVLALT